MCVTHVPFAGVGVWMSAGRSVGFDSMAEAGNLMLVPAKRMKIDQVACNKHVSLSHGMQIQSMESPGDVHQNKEGKAGPQSGHEVSCVRSCGQGEAACAASAAPSIPCPLRQG